MADRDDIIEELKVKLGMLIKRQATLEKYEETARQLKQENALLKQQYDELKTASTLKVGGKDMKETKLYISRLIREIDKCIALLGVD